MSNWNGTFSNLKVSCAAHPELHKELSGLNHKERSERLRTLATIGLMYMQSSRQLGSHFSDEKPVPPVVASSKESDRSKKKELLSRIIPGASAT